jgi:glycosyltransferase involved in cell wall biosynthesis
MDNLSRSVSIIIRSKNESKWIGSCLKAIRNQNYDKKKIQVIVLDNNSVDGTKEIVKKYKIKLINYKPKNYFPGSALNLAVKYAKKEIVVFLSAHCIPTSKNWLNNLINSFEDNTAAVYGKQLPYSFSSYKDKRDLFNQFGLEKRIQKKDNFFHNANSAVLKRLLKKYPFNSKVRHIEDRIWAKDILKKKYNIVYEPKASVWHYHGLNHSNDESRSVGVGKILENLIIKKSRSTANLHKTHNLLTIISHNPLRKNSLFLKDLEKFKKLMSKNMFLGEVCVLTHSPEILNKIKKQLFFNSFLLKNKSIRTIKKIKIGLLNFEKNKNKIIDAVMIVDVDHILKSVIEYKKLFEKFFSNNHDTVIPIKKDYDMYWKKYSNNELIRLDDVGKLKRDKEPLYKSYSSFATVISPELIYEEKRLGDNIGCIIIK